MKAHAIAKCVAVVLAAATIATLTSGNAVALSRSPSPSASGQLLATLKQRCDQEISRRLTTLNQDLSTITSADKSLTDSDRATLSAQVKSDINGLSTLQQTIAADTMLVKTRSDCHLIVSDYRVYELEQPKIHLVLAADRLTALDAKITALEPKLQALINAASGEKKTQAQAALNDIEASVSKSQAALSGVVAGIINLDPAQYPNFTGVLKSARDSVQAARSDLDGVRGDIQKIRDTLKNVSGSASSPASSPTPTA